MSDQTDIAGNTLQIGDKVVTTVAHYRDLVIGEVVGFTAKNVKVKTGSRHSTWAESQQGYILKGFGYVCKIITDEEKQQACDKAFEIGREQGHEAGYHVGWENGRAG